MSDNRVIVLGAGMVGSAIALNLREDCDVSVVDSNPERLAELRRMHKLRALQCDLSVREELERTVKNFDLVIGAVPGYMGYQVLKNTIEAGKNIVDISFFPEDPFKLDNLAKEKKVTAIIDCGIAPGMSNIILGYHNTGMEVENFECIVGGLPFKRTKPFEYKAPFSPADVIEEYTRPARMMLNGKIVTKPALSEPEQVNINPVGTLEAFNTDGLRTLLRTMKIPNMKEKTLRYPGHIEAVRILKDSGFFDKRKIEINGLWISPLQFTEKMLFPLWKPEVNEPEFTIMRIKIEGKENGVLKSFIYTLFDKYDEKGHISSMARTTGYTCAAAARLVLNGGYSGKGISPPEFVGAFNKCFKTIINELKSRNVRFELQENIL